MILHYCEYNVNESGELHFAFLNLLMWLGEYAFYRWCHDIGREHAANRPLLKTIFEVASVSVTLIMTFVSVTYFNLFVFLFLFEVLMRLFSPRKTTLLLVIRDKTKVWTVSEKTK